MREPAGSSQSAPPDRQQSVDEALDEMSEFYEKTGQDGPLKQVVDTLRGNTAGLSRAGDAPDGNHGSSKRDQE